VDILTAATATTIPGLSSASAVGSAVPFQVNGGGGVGTSLDLASLAGALVDVLAIASTTALVGIVIIAVVANRADPDPTGRRPQSVYYFVVSFVTLTTAVIGSAFCVASVLWLTAHHPASSGNGIARLLLVSALVFAASAGLFVTHLRRGLALARVESVAANPSHRIGQSYVSVVAFVAILTLLISGVAGAYLIFAVASPATFGSFGGRSVSVRVLIELVYLAAIAVLVLWTHGPLLTPRLRLLARAPRRPGPEIPPSGGTDPVAPRA
jgi:hypothetical protein